MANILEVRLAGAFGLGFVALAGTGAWAAENPRVAAEIMELARAQWAAEVAGKSVDEQMSSVADDYTEFNPVWPTRIDGKSTSARLDGAALGNDGARSIVGDMLNPKVQVYGDTAILSYNYVGYTKDKEGKLTPNPAKSTRVYHRQKGRWMLVHANFAPVVTPDN